MANSHLAVEAFLPGVLSARIAALSEGERSTIGEYLDGYADATGCKTLVVENDYIDGDFLDDYAAYYSRCFQHYSRRCFRVHLFSSSFSEEDLSLAIVDGAGSADLLQGAYLGFLVVRPLRNAPIGRTVLQVFPSDGERRFYPAIRYYDANLCGIPLRVESLAYQQQDSVVAACATASLWCAFHKTSRLFHSQLPRPAEITSVASKATSPGRVFPNHGLDLRQICNAIRAVGLEPELFKITPETYLPSLILAHLSAEIPVIVCAEIEGLDHHAFTVSGYSMLPSVHGVETSGDQALPMRGRRVNALYVHDDQIGPFAKLDVSRGVIDGEDATFFSGTWKAEDGSYRRIVPWAVIVPVYNKIRVNFIDIQEYVLRLHEFFGAIAEHLIGSDCEWSIELTTVNRYKERVRINPRVPRETKASVLLDPQPKFIWKTNLRIGSATAVQLLADATGVRDELPFYRVVWYSTETKAAAAILLRTLPEKVLLRALDRPLLNFLLKHVQP